MCAYIHTYTCIYTYLHIHLYIYTYIYIYTCEHFMLTIITLSSFDLLTQMH